MEKENNTIIHMEDGNDSNEGNGSTAMPGLIARIACAIVALLLVCLSINLVIFIAIYHRRRKGKTGMCS